MTEYGREILYTNGEITEGVREVSPRQLMMEKSAAWNRIFKPIKERAEEWDQKIGAKDTPIRKVTKRKTKKKRT